MTEQQLVITTLVDRTPVTLPETRYMLGWDGSDQDRPGQYVIVLEPVTPDDLLANDPGQAYGSVRVLTDQGVEIVSTVCLGLLVIKAE